MKLKIEDLLSLEDYDDQREVIKKDLINHKKNIVNSLLILPFSFAKDFRSSHLKISIPLGDPRGPKYHFSEAA